MSDILIIKSAEFTISATRPEQYPEDNMPEVAFAGRSNVGKSSLINCLLQRKKLVRTSRTPGRTQLINFFTINDAFRFIDLPGYGYAKVSENIRATWGPMIETYLQSRASLKAVIAIIDSRHPPTPDDLSLWGWLKAQHIPAIPVLTKVDKLPRSKWSSLAQGASRLLSTPPEDFILFSAETNLGRPELLQKVQVFIGA